MDTRCVPHRVKAYWQEALAAARHAGDLAAADELVIFLDRYWTGAAATGIFPVDDCPVCAWEQLPTGCVMHRVLQLLDAAHGRAVQINDHDAAQRVLAVADAYQEQFFNDGAVLEADCEWCRLVRKGQDRFDKRGYGPWKAT